MEKELKITKEKVLKTVEENPSIKNVMKSLFPEAFEDNRRFCNIGSLLVRTSHPDSFYAVVRMNSQVRIMNVTFSSFWENPGTRCLNISDIKDRSQRYITYSEFEKILGPNKNDFKVITTDNFIIE